MYLLPPAVQCQCQHGLKGRLTSQGLQSLAGLTKHILGIFKVTKIKKRVILFLLIGVDESGVVKEGSTMFRAKRHVCTLMNGEAGMCTYPGMCMHQISLFGTFRLFKWAKPTSSHAEPSQPVTPRSNPGHPDCVGREKRY